MFDHQASRGFAPAGTAVAVALALGLAACGRSAPPEAQADTGNDPEIAGVSITSPDAVVSTEPGSGATIPAALTTPPPASAGAYTVQPGDTLSGIAGQFGITIDALARANGITDLNSIKPGQQLTIPAAPVDQPASSDAGDGAGPSSSTVPIETAPAGTGTTG